jgi:Asp-tRNA(Asn)/Glu-tRNA(Gln) amidotransferase A subunit family amidase
MTYDLKSVKLPRLGTTGLRALVAALKLPIIGPALTERLKKDAGLTRIRDITPDDAPMLYPLLPADDHPVPPLVHAAVPHEPPGFRFPGIDDYTRAYRDGRITPLDVAAQFLAQREKSEKESPGLRAFIAVNADDVMVQARASTERWRAGRALGPFDGVPVAVKDEMDQAGYGTTVGTKFLGRTPALEDATPVARLRAAGAMLVGKTNMHEVGINVTGLNPHHGTTRNPYDDAYHTGASSSGSGTAVAAGLVPVALGADGGGSIRIPSSFCGVVGIKPTFGRVSEFGAAPLAWSVGFIGPMATSVSDCSRAYAVMAGADPRDPNSLGHPGVELDEGMPGSLAGVRLGVYWPWFRHATGDVVATAEALLKALIGRGATLHEVDIPELDAMRVAHIVSITGDMSAAMMRHWAEHSNDFGLDAHLNLRIARSATASEYVNAARMRARAIGIFQRALGGVDAIITPSTGQTAPRINPAAQPYGESDLSTTIEIMRFAFPANFTGHPAIGFPAGYDSNGLPVGMQAIGRAWGERMLFRIAAAAESIVERRAPRGWFPSLPG